MAILAAITQWKMLTGEKKDRFLTTVYRKFENEMLARTAIELGILLLPHSCYIQTMFCKKAISQE
jgi:hypothetical protein